MTSYDRPRPLRRLALRTAIPLFLLVGMPLGGLPAAAAEGGKDAAKKLTQEVAGHLEKAQGYLDTILAVEGNRTVENTLDPLNELTVELNAAGSKAGLLENVHPDKVVREAGEKASQDVSAFVTELSLNRDVFDAIMAVDVPSDDKHTLRLVEHNLRSYRRSGVDKDEATREKIRAHQEELVLISQEFGRNIREGRLEVKLTGTDELDGLPEDYIKNHPADENGVIMVSTDYPDYIPMMKYATNRDVRKRMYHAFNNRGYPKNKQVMEKLLVKRFELAQLLGYENWAEFITEDKMSGSAATVSNFIEQLDQAAAPRAQADVAVLLERKREDFPSAKVVEDWEKSYYQELVKAEQYNFDSQILRDYYNYPAVKDGILNLTSTLFGVEFKKVEDAPVWEESVEHYEMFENGELTGRFYLDMHPRDGKYNHAAQFPLVTGIKGVQVPEAVLVCNFPAPANAGLALMSHDQVETFLHEFGHLLHTLFGGHHRWADQSGIATEWDFVEAPSQMLEEWSIDAPTLQTFAKHHQTGEPVPAELVENLRRAQEFGNGLYVTQQNFYTAMSLNIYNRRPENVDMDAILQELQAKYSAFPYVEDTHMYTSFGHLDGYSAMYYTYLWSLVIAKDLFSKFNTDDLLDTVTAMEYRNKVLTPGGTEDAADLIEDFLGRPYSFEAFARWLSGAS